MLKNLRSQWIWLENILSKQIRVSNMAAFQDFNEDMWESQDRFPDEPIGFSKVPWKQNVHMKNKRKKKQTSYSRITD